MNTPVLFLVFNRPDTTKKVFEKIREARPPKLYVAADGPREDRPGEAAKCEGVREISTNVDWDCEVNTLYRDKNLGCKHAVSGAIDWFFEQEEMGIILEDDCLPNESFFRFCERLLERYKDDNRIMHINGNNYGARNYNFYDSSFSYHFSHMPHPWGWATWRRAWNLYDLELKSYSKGCLYENSYWDKIFTEEKYKKRQFEKWDKIKKSEIDTWDFSWQYTVMVNSGLCAVPKSNLISNIGYGENATHTKNQGRNAELATDSIDLPLAHPDYIIPDGVIDRYYQKNMLGKSSLLTKLKNKTINYFA